MFEANAWLYNPLSAHLSCSLYPCLHVQACLQKTPDASYSRPFSYAHKALCCLAARLIAPCCSTLPPGRAAAVGIHAYPDKRKAEVTMGQVAVRPHTQSPQVHYTTSCNTSLMSQADYWLFNHPASCSFGHAMSDLA